MSRAIYTASSGMVLELKRQEAIARNLAAANFPGFKKEFIVSENFNKILGDKLNSNGMTGTGGGNVKIDFTQGPLQETDRRLDFAIQGKGFFEVTSKDNKTLYTRNGGFFIAKDGKLVTPEGYAVAGETGELRFESRDNVSQIQVTADGMVQVRQGKETDYKMKNLGKLKIVDIEDKDKLVRVTANYFAVSDDDKRLMTVCKNEDYQTINGYLEMSNSSPMMDMTAMIQSQREFEMGQKLIKMLDDRHQKELQKLT
ncbi:MAG: hypothetical protein A2017_09785 [Lentisphaerae bacterium GWF2_44_16]|nr:MAG: hypothetical protein A2017_09785 [Lentisphaerae bacterium GWF2_44_16]